MLHSLLQHQIMIDLRFACIWSYLVSYYNGLLLWLLWCMFGGTLPLIFISVPHGRWAEERSDDGGGDSIGESGYREHLHRDRKYKHIIQPEEPSLIHGADKGQAGLPLFSQFETRLITTTKHHTHTHTTTSEAHLKPMLCLVLNPIIIIIKKMVWFGRILYTAYHHHPHHHLWEFWARQVVCNRIPHPNCFLISKTVKFSTKALRQPKVRSSRCNERSTKNIRYYFSCAFFYQADASKRK